MKYKAIIRASKGWLIGGVRRTESAWFDDLEHARGWLEAALEENRKVRVMIGTKPAAPEGWLVCLDKGKLKQIA